MAANPSRDDFSATVIDILARRVGMRCSNPNCRQLTSGPRAEASKAVNIGVAAHISAASLGGPRYDSTLTPEQRSSAENGIWLCQNHAKLVDNDAQKYTMDLLREWKQGAENAAHREIIGKVQEGQRKAAFEVVAIAERGNAYSVGIVYTLIVQLRNSSEKTARNVVVEIGHDETHCVGMEAARGVWQDESPAGRLNPKRLRMRQNLNPDEHVVVLGIPTVPNTPFPFAVALKLWAEDTPMHSYGGTITEEQALTGIPVLLELGMQLTKPPTKSNTRPQPNSKAGQMLLAGILESPDVENRGITEILEGYPGEPLTAAFMFSTAQFVNPQFGHPEIKGLKKRFFREGINELLLLGWLHESEESSGTALYEFNPDRSYAP